MTHTGVESIEISLPDLKDFFFIRKTDDHELKDYIKYDILMISKWSPFKPSDMKKLQGEKGMIPIGFNAFCECECCDLVSYSEGRKNNGHKKLFIGFFTNIDQEFEESEITRWIEDYKKRLRNQV